MDLCVMIFRESSNSHQAFGSLVANSQRQLKSFVGCNTMLEPGEYVITALAFNHWSTGIKLLNKRTREKIAVTILKFEQCGSTIE